MAWADMTMNDRLREARRTGTDGDYDDKIEWCIDTLASAARGLQLYVAELETQVMGQHAIIVQAEAEVEALKDELERERLRLVACSVAAMENTPELASKRIDDTSRYYSASYADVCNAVDREMALRADRDRLRGLVERGYGVFGLWDMHEENTKSCLDEDDVPRLASGLVCPYCQWLIDAREVLEGRDG